MQTTKTTLVAGAVLLITACTALKKRATPTVKAAPAAPISMANDSAKYPATDSVKYSPNDSVKYSASDSVKYPANDSVKTHNLLSNPLNGVYAPGIAELRAIQVQYKTVTSHQLNEGYNIYTKGACINCHNPNGIYQFTETKWKIIIDSMAPKAELSDKEKDAVYKYVLSIKAAQSPERR
jgi:cytochrome c551/c552